MARPWDRREGETERSYALFLVYRDLGPTRSLQRVADADFPEDWLAPGLRIPNEQKVRTLSARWDWVERVRAWDNHLQSVRDRQAAAEAAKWEKRRQKAVETAYELSQALLDKAKVMARFPVARERVERTSRDGEPAIVHLHPAGWAIKDLASIIKTGVDLEASAIRAMTADPADLPDDELSAVADADEA